MYLYIIHVVIIVTLTTVSFSTRVKLSAVCSKKGQKKISSCLFWSFRKREHENANLKFLNTQCMHKVKALEKDAKSKTNKIQEKNLHAILLWKPLVDKENKLYSVNIQSFKPGNNSKNVFVLYKKNPWSTYPLYCLHLKWLCAPDGNLDYIMISNYF